jgi:uncharacterized HhH-GPD family protein
MMADQISTPFTGDDEADRLLSVDGLALLTGMLLDQQVPMEWAFRGPLELKQRLGKLSASDIAAMDPEALREVFCVKPALHRYPGSMATRMHELCTFIVERYDGRAESIWETACSGDQLFARLRELPGYGEQKAKIFLSILAKRLAVTPAGWEAKAGLYGEPGFRSIADVDGPGAIDKVRAYKQDMKAKAKAKAVEKAPAAAPGPKRTRAPRSAQ